MGGDARNRFRDGGELLWLASATHSATLAAFAVTAALVGAWLSTYLAGGTHTAIVHVFYVPIVAAASRFRHPGALLAALCGGVLAGPLMPLDVGTGAVQQPVGWLFRAAFFVLIGQLVALLSHSSLDRVSTAVADRRTRKELETALERGEFRLVYQPLVDLNSGVAVGVEALLRWDDPRRGTATPDAFIAAAERTGAIVPIGRWVLHEAVRQLAEWQACGPNAPLRLAINISACQLEDDGLIAEVAAALQANSFCPAVLELEVTETSLITNVASVAHRLQRLRGLGVSIAIDDFGTGQSSLAYLHRFPADIIKIDRSFVSVLGHDDNARAVAEGIVKLARALGATTVAEGVETPYQAALLAHLGCDVGQGYLYARPGDLDDVLSSAGHRQHSPRATVDAGSERGGPRVPRRAAP